ncbi:MAG: hypothetical protein ABSC92_16885, partial [Rhizomicrobium sp.]
TDVRVASKDQIQNRIDADLGHPTWTTQVNPPVFVVSLYKTTGSPEFSFDFRDEDTANRVAKAFSHAVELCGGGHNVEPF